MRTAVATGVLYLRIVAPTYGVFGLGMLLYFAGQDAGRVTRPVLAGAARLFVAALVGWLVVAGLGGSLDMLFITVGVSSIAFGGIAAAALRFSGWGRRNALPIKNDFEDLLPTGDAAALRRPRPMEFRLDQHN